MWYLKMMTSFVCARVADVETNIKITVSTRGHYRMVPRSSRRVKCIIMLAWATSYQCRHRGTNGLFHHSDCCPCATNLFKHNEMLSNKPTNIKRK